MSFSIERYKEESKKVDTAGIDWDTVKQHALSKGDLFCLHVRTRLVGDRHQCVSWRRGRKAVAESLVEVFGHASAATIRWRFWLRIVWVPDDVTTVEATE